MMSSDDLILLFLLALLCSTVAVVDQRHETYQLMFGDLFTYVTEDFLPPQSEPAHKTKSNKLRRSAELSKMVQKEVDDMLRLERPYNDRDMMEYNRITDSLETRRQAIYKNYWDPDDSIWGSTSHEVTKIERMLNIQMNFLYQARFRIVGALHQRKPICKDLRYRLGYLFNRMRRLLYNQRRLSSAASTLEYGPPTNFVKTRNLELLFMLYRHVLRMEVDIRDCINIIKLVYAEPDPIADMTTRKQHSQPDRPPGFGG